ncbi:MAG: efflux RND transporter permease subunit, partial [Maioricimonas sp. JB049]
SLKLAAPIALMMIYMLLAGLFRSYLQPLVVMAAIPFGIQGAIIGHWVTGYPMTILSAIGMVALTGIVVNDSLVLVDFINSRIRNGMSELDASLEGARLRLRPILLTTLTTVAGLTPLMFERSFQAKFLIPMAVTLTFGLMFATVLTLGIVPVLNMIFFDVRRLSRQIWGAGPEEESPYGGGGPSETASPAPVVSGAS